MGAKINLAYHLGIVDEDNYELLCKINEIRNTFAHGHDVSSFDHPKIKTKMKELKSVGLMKTLIQNPKKYKIWQRDWRNLNNVFRLAVTLLCFSFADTVVEKVNVKISHRYDTFLDWFEEQ